MCLVYGEEQTKIMAADLQSVGSVVAYKVLWFPACKIPIVCYNTYITHTAEPELDSLHSALYGHKWAPGDNVSTRESVVPGQDRMDFFADEPEGMIKSINRGMHVFLNIGDAMKWSKNHPQQMVVKVTCRAEHFVACNEDRTKAVFTQIHLSKEEYNKALKECGREG